MLKKSSTENKEMIININGNKISLYLGLISSASYYLFHLLKQHIYTVLLSMFKYILGKIFTHLFAQL